MELLKLDPLQKNQFRSINWHEHTVQSLTYQFPELKSVSHQMTVRLSALLLERLPERLRHRFLSLLPETVLNECSDLFTPIEGTPEETSIGYLDFVERVTTTLGCIQIDSFDYSSKSEHEMKKMTEKIADTFLWAIAQDLPPDLKTRMEETLPMDIRSRMDLYSSHSDDSKVA